MSRAPRKTPKKKVAPGKGKATSNPIKAILCSTHVISKLRRELKIAGLHLHDASGNSQRVALLKIMQYLGPRGINTPEGVGCGFYRIATRIQELEDAGWKISVPKERILGADGLEHSGVARYILIGRRNDFIDPQGSLDLGVAS
jgi:hypothetical protein